MMMILKAISYYVSCSTINMYATDCEVLNECVVHYRLTETNYCIINVTVAVSAAISVYVILLVDVINPKPNFFMRTVGLQKNLRLLFALAENTGNVLFGEKNRILQNLRLNVWQKAFVISLDGKSGKMQFTITID